MEVESSYSGLKSKIQQQRELATKDGQLNQAIENLLALEKQYRLAADVPGTRMVVLTIINICFQLRNWKALCENALLISKRRAQLKQAISALVQEAMSYIESAPDLETKIELIKTLTNVTAGKIYVEIERARLTRMLAEIRESQGDIKEASAIMQDVAVETFGAMAKTEKIAFILEQVRLCLDHGDFMRAVILSRKINPKVFIEDTSGKKKKEGEELVEPPAPEIPTLPELKLKFYELMIRYHKNSRDYLEIARSYQAIYESSSVKDDPKKWIPILKMICWYLVLSPHGSMQSSLIHATAGEKRLQDIPNYKNLLKKFTTWEVIQWSTFSQEYKGEIEEQVDVFGADGGKTLEDLRLRVTEQNILVVSKYYSKITLKRLGELLDLSVAETEKHLSELVVSKSMYARIDRPSGIVTLRANKDSNEILNSWANDIEKLLDLVEKCCHLIHKETMVHKVTLAA